MASLREINCTWARSHAPWKKTLPSKRPDLPDKRELAHQRPRHEAGCTSGGSPWSSARLPHAVPPPAWGWWVSAHFRWPAKRKEHPGQPQTPPHRRSPAGLSPPFQLAPVLPQTNRSHIYLVAETTLYIVTLRKESLNPTPNRTGLRIWNGTRTTDFPGRISKDPASSPCLPTLKRGLWERLS